VTSDLDSLPWHYPSEATRNGATGRRAKPEPDPVRQRRNKNNRKRGNRTSHDLAVYLGGRNVEALKEPWDVEACGSRIQSKRLASRPSLAAIIALLFRITVHADELRAVFYIGSNQRLASGRIFLLLDEWVEEHSWHAPDGSVLHVTNGTYVLELPVAVFREVRA